MEQFRPQSSERILERTKETGKFKEEEVEASLERNKIPLSFSEIRGVFGQDIEMMFGEKQIGFTYTSMTEEYEKKDVQDIIEWIKEKEPNLDDPAADVSNWRQLVSIRINHEDVFTLDGSGDRITPGSATIYFCPSSKLGTGIAGGDLVFLLGPLTNLSGMSTLLHEIGHLWDNENTKSLGLEKQVDEHPHSNDAETIRAERAASAFALKKLRTLLKSGSEQMRDVVNELEGYALNTYHQGIHEEILLREKKKVEEMEEIELLKPKQEREEESFRANF